MINLVDQDLVEAIEARLDLREPNRQALETIVAEVAQHYRNGQEDFFEGVVDAAVGMGKTYILAAAIEYFAAEGFRNFAVITPGEAILRKTVGNFTPGHPKSLLSGMEVRPVVITSENFASPAMRAAMEDPSEVKVFIFTVQALTKPSGTKVGRRTHKFQEGLGKGFYEHLQGLDDLVVFADEHHVYYGPAFSKAIRGLEPYALVGLTGTPHKKSEDKVIFRYPLAAAVAEEYVKTPVIVGRRDDRADPVTKLMDGVQLLEMKQLQIDRYVAQTGAEPVNAVMLVVAGKIEEAKEYAEILEGEPFMGGKYRGHVLEIHSESPDEDLEALEAVEDPDSPVRIIVAVDKLKEGWDVKSVYVICSMRASVSKILTEQTLGRGLRLPFGEYTEVEFLNTLEVVAHERYEELLKRAELIEKEFIDHRTRAVLRETMEGQQVAVTETQEVRTRVAVAEGDGAVRGRPVIGEVEDRIHQAEEEVDRLVQEIPPRDDLPTLQVPKVRTERVESPFSLADITDLDPFRQLGARLAADPETELRRMLITARVVEGEDGIPRTEIVRREAADPIKATQQLLPLEEARQQLTRMILHSEVVPNRKSERAQVERILAAVVGGLGKNAETVLSAYMERAGARIVELIAREARKVAPKPRYVGEAVELVALKPTRTARARSTEDRFGRFERGVGYEGWKKSMHPQVYFDSGTERDVANILDGAKEVAFWLRLQRGDLPILWQAARAYNPDFIVVEEDGSHWVVEVKADREMGTEEVKAKRDAVLRWANVVNGAGTVPDRWGYVLVSESDVKDVKESWPALRGLGVR